MPLIEKTALVPYPQSRMFALVDAVERYPEFLPWCGGSRVLARDAGKTIATIHVDYRGLRQSFTTENTKQGFERMQMRLIEGPFRRFEGVWQFTALGESGCKVGFSLDYSFASPVLEAAAGGVFGTIATTMIERFVARADQLFAAAV
jgi:ribosome-associated toxin RatA of RatAB toxin-antitoxin module